MKFSYTFPPFEEVITQDGFRIIYLPDFSQPVCTIALQLRCGTNNDPVSYEGTAELLAGVLQKGTRNVSGDRFAETFENAGAQLFSDVKEETMTFGAKMLVKHADSIVALFWEMITLPALSNDEFKRLHKETITGLNAEFSDPYTIAEKHFHAALFGKDHPAGRIRSIQSVKRIDINQIRQYYETFFNPRGSTLVVAGAVSVETMKNKWQSMFTSWGNKRELPSLPVLTQPSLSENKIHFIRKPQLSQATLIVGHPTVHELHEKKNCIALANFILGGGNFSSRLMKHIRSETGQTYGIASHIHTTHQYGYFSIATTTQTSQFSDVLSSIFRVYEKFVQKGATEEEIASAKQYGLGSMAFELEGLMRVVEKIMWLRFYGRDNSYIESFESILDSLTVTTVNEALCTYFASKYFTIVVVGREKEIVPVLEKYGMVEEYNFRAPM